MKITYLKVWNGESECSNLTIFRALLNNLARTSNKFNNLVKVADLKKNSCRTLRPPRRTLYLTRWREPAFVVNDSLFFFCDWRVRDVTVVTPSASVLLFFFITGRTGLCVRIHRFRWRSVWSNIAVGTIFFICQYTRCWCRYIRTSRFSSMFGVRRVLCASRSSAIRIARYMYCLPILLKSRRSHAVHKIQHHCRRVGFVLLELS